MLRTRERGLAWSIACRGCVDAAQAAHVRAGFDREKVGGSKTDVVAAVLGYEVHVGM
jgi:hypothetical protein